MEDITKTGPVGLKGLKGVSDLDSLSDSQFNSYLESLRPPSIRDIETRSALNMGRQEAVSSGLDLGSSSYDRGIYSQDQLSNASDIRAEEQGAITQIANGLAKGVVLAGTTFLDGTVGLLYGTGTAIAEGRVSGLWDNDFSRAMQEINKLSEEYIPNYYSQEELNEPWYKNIFTANFLGDKFIKNLGFSVGALYSGGVVSSALRATKLPQIMAAVTKSVKAPSMVTSGVGATISAVNEGRIEALNNSTDWENLEIAKLDDSFKSILDAEYSPMMESLQSEYDKARSEYEKNKGKLVKGVDGKMYDPAYRAYKEKLIELDNLSMQYQNSYKDRFDNREQDEFYRNSLAKIEEDKAKMGNMDLLVNLPILLASNLFQFASYYGNGLTASRRAGVRTLNREATEGARYAGKQFSKLDLGRRIVGDAVMEGFEEISQKGGSVMAGDYYSTDVSNFIKKQIDPEAEQESLSWIKSFANSINETVNDGSSWEEFFIGSLTGLLGIPAFRSTRSAEGNLQSPVQLQGGFMGEYREYTNEIQRSQELANYMNARFQSPEFLNYYRGLIRHNAYQADMNEASDRDDSFDFKNAEHAQFVSDIVMFDNAGKLSDLVTIIDSAFDVSDENLQSIVENTTSVDSEGNRIGPFVDKSGNPFYSTEEGKKTMVDKLTRNYNELKNAINSYTKAKNDIDIVTGGALNNEQLSELAWMQSQIDNWKERLNTIAPVVKQSLLDLNNNLETRLLSVIQEASIEGASDSEIESIASLSNNLGIGSDRIKQLLDLSKRSNEQLISILSDPGNQAYTSNLIDTIEAFGSDIISSLDKANVVKMMRDLPRIGKGLEVYNSKLEEYLKSPEKLIEDNDKATQEVQDKILNEKKKSIKELIIANPSVQSIRDLLSDEDNSEVADKVIEDLINEGNPVALNYKELGIYDKEIRKALASLGEYSDDVLSLWENHFNNAENVNQAGNYNSVFINDEQFFEEGSDTIEEAENRFQTAKYAVQRAISKVNNDIKFRDRFSDEYKKPVNEPVTGKGIDKDETGDSGTSTVPHVNPNATPVETPSVPVGNVTAQMVVAENSEANKRVETQRTLDQSQQGQRRYYRPAVPELHIEASKEGDFRPFDVVVGERERGVDFSGIYSYLRDNGAFSYVNAAKLKPGDTLGFMIDPEFNDHTIFLVDTRNNQIVGSIDESDASVARYEGLEEVIKKVRDEFSKRGEEATGKFFATPQTRVSKMMVGRIPYTSEERSLADIPGVLDGEAKPMFGIIKNGTLTTNEKIDDRLIIKPSDMAQKEGRLYLLIPNAAGTYSPASVRVKHFNVQEFNLNDATVASTPIGKDFNDVIEKLADSMSEDDVTLAVKDLASLLYIRDLHIDYFSSYNGEGIRIVKVQRDDTGAEVYEINSKGERVRKEDKDIIYFQTSKDVITYAGMDFDKRTALQSVKEGTLPSSILDEFSQLRDPSDIKRDILNSLLRFNLPLQVSASNINGTGYNERIIKSNILTSNLREAKVISSWFTTDYFDNQGNLQRAISPSSVKPAPSRRTTTPVGGTEGVIQGTPVRIGNSTYTVDLKTMVYTDSKGTKYGATTSNANIFAMAWAQENFGDSTESSVMTENKVITPQGRVLDRNTGQYVSDAEAKRIKDKIAGISQATQNRITESKRVIADIYENQKRVDKARTDSDYYYVLEDDGQYHEYSRVHSRLGDNWLGERTETENSRRALETGTAVDKVIRDFFTSKETPVKPETLSESAFIDLISKLTEIKSKMEQMGETFMADNIVLFQKYADGTRVAGEVDILSVDKNGNFKIYDVKTSRYSFGDRYFTEKSSKQRMSTKDYYTLQLSAYQNLFESQYGVRPTRLAILPFVLSYDKDKVSSIEGEKGIPITYNPAVNVPLASTVQTPQQQETLPIFDSTMETMITKPEEQNRVLPENAFEEGGEIGYYEKDNIVYTGYLKKIGEVDGVPIHLTKVRDRGFGREGEFGSTSEYLTVFPNGMTISTRTNDTNDDHAARIILEALSKNPAKVRGLASEKTQISNGFEKKGEASAQPSGATTTIQREDAINNHDEEFEDELDLGELRRVDDSSRELWNQEKELAWIKKVLPQLSEQDRIRVVKGLIQVADNGPVAWGRFSDGIIELSDVAAEGTTYHEAFHAVFHLMLTPQEREALLEEARVLYGTGANLEEEMAEGFREYVASQETRGLGRKILDFFKNLFAKVTNWKYVKPSLINYYRMINQGRYANISIPALQVSDKKGLSFGALSSETRQALEAKGWTQEKFDSISQKERDQAVECVGL